MYLLLFFLIFFSSVDANLVIKDVTNEMLKLNDDSEWVVKKYSFWDGVIFEKDDISHWEPYEEVTLLYPSFGNFTEFCLIVRNEMRNEEAYVDLQNAPSIKSSDTVWIYAYDEKKKKVMLSDGSIWIKGSVDMHGAFFSKRSKNQKEWQTGDVVSIINSEGFLIKDKLLWNHNTNEMPFIKSVTSCK